MKIQNNGMTLEFPDYNKNQGRKRMNDMLPVVNDQPVKVSISEEGYKSYRANIPGGQTYDDVVKQREFLTGVRLSADMNYHFTLSEKINSLNEADKATSENGFLSYEDKLSNIAEAYRTLGDEIVQGYANGTREIHVADNDSESGYRILTMQEELAALEDAYEGAVRGLAVQMEQQPRIQAALEQYIRKLQKIGGNQTELITKAGEELENNRKLSEMKTITDNVRKLSAVNSFQYFVNFESALSGLGNGNIDGAVVSGNDLQEKINQVKSGAESEENYKTDRFDRHVNKMVSIYTMMRDSIEEKYANPDYEQEYYVAENGEIEKLTKEKELAMLDRAYEMHSEFMATSTEIWENLRNNPPHTVYDGKTENTESQTIDRRIPKGDIKNQAFRAFMSAISLENRTLFLQEKGGLNSIKLNLNISSSARSTLNDIWDYYAREIR